MSFKLSVKPITWKKISQYYKASTHRGIDLAAPTGTKVYAAAAGTVVAASYGAWDKSYGKMVAIYHNNGNYTNYAHLSKIKVRVGQKVKAGKLIGLCGSTGHSTGPHLHFEVHKGRKWNRVNPKPYLDAIGKKTASQTYKKGGTYTLQYDMNLRISHSSSSPLVGVSHWTKSAQKYATKNGLLKKGTKVTAKEIVTKSGGETWIHTPSGWICAVNSKGKVYIK